MKTALIALAIVASASAYNPFSGLIEVSQNLITTLDDIETQVQSTIGRLSTLAQGSDANLLSQFKNLQCDHGKDDATLLANLRGNIKNIISNLGNPNSQNPNAVQDLTCMAAYTPAEFKSMQNLKPQANPNSGSPTPVASRRRRAAAPASVDWRTQGYVTGVKNQGQCGSCWTFSATGALEGALYKKTKNLVSLSEQNLVDCVKASNGCNGGWPGDAFDYVKNNTGIDTEASYSYTAANGTCKYNKAYNAGTIVSWTYTNQNDEVDLMNKVAVVGPISVAIDASDIQNYKSGVWNCAGKTLNHGVLLVGYGTDSQLGPYWIVKNSWGTTWGESGYIRIKRDTSGKNANSCGIATAPHYPVA